MRCRKCGSINIEDRGWKYRGHNYACRRCGEDWYINHCWNCEIHRTVDDRIHPRCAACGWCVCSCGACSSNCGELIAVQARSAPTRSAAAFNDPWASCQEPANEADFEDTVWAGMFPDYDTYLNWCDD